MRRIGNDTEETTPAPAVVIFSGIVRKSFKFQQLLAARPFAFKQSLIRNAKLPYLLCFFTTAHNAHAEKRST